VRRERTAAALDPGAADVVEDQVTVAQVAPCQRPLHRALAKQQPVERAIQLILGGALHAELGGKGRGGKAARGGQLRGGLQDARHDERHGQVALAGWAPVQGPLQAEAPEHAQGRCHVPVG